MLLAGVPAAPSAGAGARTETVAGAGRGDWTVEIAGECLREAWDYNLSDEDLFGYSTGVMRRVSRRWSVGTELLTMGVHQERVPSTVVSGLATVMRWHGPATRVSYFAEGGVGMSYAASEVPQRGTRFNYVAHMGAGITRSLGPGVNLIATLRWLHLSNSGIAGRSRNPDIQAVGLRVGVAMPLGRARGVTR